MSDVLHDEPLCAGGCGYNVAWCACPPPAQPARPAYVDTYPPLYCQVCAAPVFRMPCQHKSFHERTCSTECAKELERRYYGGTILHKPYARAP